MNNYTYKTGLKSEILNSFPFVGKEFSFVGKEFSLDGKEFSLNGEEFSLDGKELPMDGKEFFLEEYSSTVIAINNKSYNIIN